MKPATTHENSLGNYEHIETHLSEFYKKSNIVIWRERVFLTLEK